MTIWDRTAIRMVEAEAGGASLLKLMTWLSPAFPVGAFAYSHGLEAAVAEGALRDEGAVLSWLEALLSDGSGWNDLVLLAEAYRAAQTGDAARLADVGDLARALGGSAERRMETADLGLAFAAASTPWREPAMTEDTMAYPVAVGALAARQGVDLRMTLTAYGHAFAANLLGACVRLVPLGQRDATSILFRLEPMVLSCADRACGSSLDDLGSAAFFSEIASMRHETLAIRLFRS